MRTLLLLVLLVACNGKRSETPSVDRIDRTCQVDGDCMIAGTLDCCGRRCGESLGPAVNVKAWTKAFEDSRAGCANANCPSVMCQKPPECRDIARAVCTNRRCERVLEKTPACGQQPDGAP